MRMVLHQFVMQPTQRKTNWKPISWFLSKFKCTLIIITIYFICFALLRWQRLLVFFVGFAYCVLICFMRWKCRLLLFYSNCRKWWTCIPHETKIVTEQSWTKPNWTYKFTKLYWSLVRVTCSSPVLPGIFRGRDEMWGINSFEKKNRFNVLAHMWKLSTGSSR